MGPSQFVSSFEHRLACQHDPGILSVKLPVKKNILKPNMDSESEIIAASDILSHNKKRRLLSPCWLSPIQVKEGKEMELVTVLYMSEDILISLPEDSYQRQCIVSQTFLPCKGSNP